MVCCPMMNMLIFKHILQIIHWSEMLFSKRAVLEKFAGQLVVKGRGGGVRVIYYRVTVDSQIRLLLIYKKGIQDDLTPEQKKILRCINERW